MGKSRSRHKIDQRPAGIGIMYADLYGLLSSYNLAAHSYPKKLEYMDDTIGYLGCDFNPCFHDKLLIAAKPFSVLEWAYNPISGLRNQFYFTAGHGPFLRADCISIFREGLEIPQTNEDLDDYSAKADHHFKTAVDDTHSLLNFLIELIQMCEGNIGKLAELSKKIAKAMKAFREMYSKTGNYWLSWNFCIKPTIGDLQAMIDVMKAAKKRLAWLKRRNKLDTKVKYRQSGWTGQFTTEVAAVHWPDCTDPFTYLVPADCSIELVYTVTCKPSSWAWVRFDIPDYLLEGPEGLGIMWAAMAGLYNPLKVAWEAVPFSWLIDWFISKRTQLQLEAASLSPLKDATILGVGTSLLYEYEGQIIFRGPPAVVGETERQSIEIGNFQYTCFMRSPGYPESDALPFRIPFKWYNASIIGALLQQKKRRGHRRG